jgi:hypothetical protein
MRPVRPPVRLPHSHIDRDWTCAGVPIQSRSLRLSGAEMRFPIQHFRSAKGNLRGIWGQKGRSPISICRKIAEHS